MVGDPDTISEKRFSLVACAGHLLLHQWLVGGYKVYQVVV